MGNVLRFTVDLIPITKKNNMRIAFNRGTGKPFILPSSKYVEYEQNALWFIPKNKHINEAVNVKCLFYMPTRRRVDLTNLLEAIDDVMVKAGLLEDDNFNIIAGHDGSRVLYDKEHPRTEVEITPMTE